MPDPSTGSFLACLPQPFKPQAKPAPHNQRFSTADCHNLALHNSNGCADPEALDNLPVNRPCLLPPLSCHGGATDVHTATPGCCRHGHVVTLGCGELIPARMGHANATGTQQYLACLKQTWLPDNQPMCKPVQTTQTTDQGSLGTINQNIPLHWVTLLPILPNCNVPVAVHLLFVAYNRYKTGSCSAVQAAVSAAWHL
jgi:hypothetical protein